MRNLKQFLAVVGPGMLTAATGVGAGDLATGSIVGSLLGTAVLWAVIIGAYMKFVVTEGITRWQLATGTTLLEGLTIHFGRVAAWIFLPYLLLFSYFIGTAMMSACGVTLHAMIPLFDDAVDGKNYFGIACSLIGLAMVYKGGYQLFEKVMHVCIAVMFVSAVVTAGLLWDGTDSILSGMLVPTIPDFDGEGLTWTIALIGGVGGTVTVLSYGYWIREEGRLKREDLPDCRLDLAAGYLMTAVFCLAMVIIGSHVSIEGGGATLLVKLSDQLGNQLGPWGKWLFLIGSFGAVFSSLLGVWQSIPYIFADTWRLALHSQDEETIRAQSADISKNRKVYHIFMVLLAIVPMLGLFASFQQAQKFYTVTGAYFFPALALALILLNSREKWVGKEFKYGPVSILMLVATIAFFLWATAMNIQF